MPKHGGKLITPFIRRQGEWTRRKIPHVCDELHGRAHAMLAPIHSHILGFFGGVLENTGRAATRLVFGPQKSHFNKDNAATKKWRKRDAHRSLIRVFGQIGAKY